MGEAGTAHGKGLGGGPPLPDQRSRTSQVAAFEAVEKHRVRARSEIEGACAESQDVYQSADA